MDEDRKKRAYVIINQFLNQIDTLVKVTDKEIVQLTDDYAKSFECEFDKKLKPTEWGSAYDNFLLSFIQGVLSIRTNRSIETLNKSMKEIEDNKSK